MQFLCANPGPGEASQYTILITDVELATVTLQAQLLTLVTTKLQRKFRSSGIASKIDPFVNTAITI
jgi:hypothetical protein